MRLFLTIALLALAGSAPAQRLWTDDTPWDILETPRAFGFEAFGMDDNHSGWQVAGGAVLAGLPSGEGRAAYVRWPHLSVSQGGLRAADRWDGILSADLDEPDLWPGEDRIDGWGRPEAGYLARAHWPVFGTVSYAAMVWLPLTSEALYPFAARALSLGLAVRRDFSIGRSAGLAFECRRITNTSMSDEVLTSAAMPTLLQGAVSLSFRAGDLTFESGLLLDDAEARRWRGQVRYPLGEGQLNLKIEHDFAATEARLFGYRVVVGWSIASLVTEEGSDDESRP